MLQHCQTSHPDHFAVMCKLDFPAPAASKKVVRRRFIRSINMENWKSDLKECLQTLDQPSDINTAVVSLDVSLRVLLDKHAPEVTRISVLRPNALWFSSHLRELKRTKRQCERKYISTRLEVPLQIYREQCAIYLTEINAAKSDYYRNKIMEKDPNQRFHLIDGLFHVKKEKPLPTCDSTTKIAQQFSLFFASKIEKLRADIPTQVHVHNPTRSTTVISMHHFEHVSEDLVSRILRKSPSKSCSLDAIPTNLLKDSSDIILPYITELFNISLVSGVFPDQFKKAIIRPSLKKPHLDPEDYSNYRPIANLSFLSKTLKRIMANPGRGYSLIRA